MCGFISFFHFPHPHRKDLMKVHRLVVMPDYQGIGIGMTLLNFTAKKVKEQNKTLGITSSILNLKRALNKSVDWILRKQNREKTSSSTGTIHRKGVKGSVSSNRITYTFEYNG